MIYNFCMSSNDNYIKYFCVLIQAILSNLKQPFDNDKFDFHLMYSSLTEENITKIRNFEVRLKQTYNLSISLYKVDTELFKKLNIFTWGEGSDYTSYYRLYIDNMLPNDITLCLYLDIDVVVCDDLRELFNFDLNGKVAAGVSDLREIDENAKSNILKGKNASTPDFIFKPDGSYINAGVLLMDLAIWRSEKLGLKALKFMAEHEVYFPDQDAINAVLLNRLAVLDQRWGLMPIMAGMTKNKQGMWISSNDMSLQKVSLHGHINLPEEFKHPKLFHMTTIKPWGTVSDIPNYGLSNYVAERIQYAISKWQESAKLVSEYYEELYPYIYNFSDLVIIRQSKLIVENFKKLSKYKKRLNKKFKLYNISLIILFLMNIVALIINII